VTKHAHLITRPEQQVGERVLGLCGKDFKLKVLWDDLPSDYPICRPCVDMALMALKEADTVITLTRLNAIMADRAMDRLTRGLSPEDGLALDRIAEKDQEHADAQAEKKQAKAERKREKQTCTCTWTSPEVFEEDPDCPIHGGHLDAIGVEITEEEE
jgi:hypothetical protein